MPESVERLTLCGVNLIDALDVYDDYMCTGDREGLADFVAAVETEYLARISTGDS